MRPLYSVENLVFSYNSSRKGPGAEQNGQEILNIPELSIAHGKTYVLLGPNGSGKTTLLKLLNRLLSPTAGTIRFLGADIFADNRIRTKTVYVHQTPLLFSGTVQSNVAYGLKLRNYSHKEIETRVHRTLKVVGLEGFEKRKSSSLSGGEAQRVAIARALTIEPEVILLDEPTSSIDKKNIGKIEELLTSIRRDYGCSIIISTHNMPFAYRMCDTLIKLEEGRMVPPGENIIPGGIISANSAEGIGYRTFRSGGVDIYCPDLEGDFTKAVIDYDRILLSREPLHSSAQNSFRGSVESMVPADAHGLVDVSVRIGDLLLTSRITEKSLRELSISEGSEICLAFKASSVRLY